MKLFAKLMWMLTLCVVVLGLASCKPGEDPNNNGGPAVVDNEVIFSPYVNTTLVLGEGVIDADVRTIKTAYYKQLGKELKVSTSATPGDHEIIVGKNDRELSKKAYRYLVALENEDGYVGYVICSDGKSVAIAYNDKSFGEDVAFNEAITFFVEKHMAKSALKFTPGIVHYDTFDPIAKQAENDNAEIERMWNLKLSQLTKNMENAEDAEFIIEELKKLRQVFSADDDFVAWIANLYDPATGGFYYSNSARNNETYLPDLESTYQAIGLIEMIITGYEGSLVNYLGEEIAGAFVTFVNNMQAEDNGYFYHPQWPKEAIDKNVLRRTADLNSAVGILNYFSASPKYDTPNGIKGSDTVTPVSGMTTPLTKSTVSAVSYVVSANASVGDIYVPPHLKDAAQFTTYLQGFRINSDTAAACEKILSELAQYRAVDEYAVSNGEEPYVINALIKFLARYQLGTGTWSSDANIYTAFAALSDVAKVYNALETPIPNAIDIFGNASRLLQFNEAELTNIADVTDPWAGLAAAVENLVAYTTGDEAIETLKWRLSDLYYSLCTALPLTREALGKFMRDDGTFSTTPDGDANTSYDMPISLPLIIEGDMNAAYKAAKTLWTSVFGVLDMSSVALFSTSDRMFLQKTLLELGVVIKNEIEPAEPIDFEKYSIGDKSDIGTGFQSSESYARVEADPTGAENQVLHIFSAKQASAEYATYKFESVQANSSCYTAEFDMLVKPSSSQQMFAQIRFTKSAFCLAIVNMGNEVRFMQKSAQGFSDSRMMDIGVSAKLDEWFNLRIEYYPATRENFRIKIYFNDECVVVNDYFWTSQNESSNPAKTLDTFEFLGYANYEANLYLDNIILEGTYKAYTPETDDLNYNIDALDGPQIKHDFEIGAYPDGMTATGGSANVTFKPDPTNEEGETNKVLAVNEKAGTISLPVDQRGPKANAAMVQYDMIVDANSAAGAIYQLNFNEFGRYYTYAKRTFGSLHILVREENGEKYAVLAEAVSGSTGTIFDAVKLELGKKYTINFYLFFKECTMAVAIDGEMVGMSTSVDANAKMCYMGEINLVSKTSSVASTLYIDNLIVERTTIDFEEATAPKVDRVTGSFDGNDNMTFDGVAPSGGVLAFDGVTEGTASVKIPVNVRVSVPTTGILGFDVTNATVGTIVAKLEDAEGNVIVAFALTYREGGVDVHEYTANGKYPTFIHRQEGTNFSISLEYSPKDEAFNILVNGEYVAASQLNFTKGSCALDYAYATISNDGYAAFTIDNLYAEEVTSVFLPHDVTLENADSIESVITYETSSFASYPSRVSISDGHISAYHRIVEDKIDGEVTKVLVRFTADVKDTASYTSFTKTSTEANANAVYFETDLKLESLHENLYFMYAFQSSSSVHPEISIVASATDGSALTMSGGSGKITLKVHEGEWFKFRTEYMSADDDFDYDGKADYIVRIYINDELVDEFKKSTSNPTSAVKNIRTRNSSGSTGYIYFDNTSFGDFQMQYEKPIPPDTDTITFTPA